MAAFLKLGRSSLLRKVGKFLSNKQSWQQCVTFTTSETEIESLRKQIAKLTAEAMEKDQAVDKLTTEKEQSVAKLIAETMEKEQAKMEKEQAKMEKDQAVAKLIAETMEKEQAKMEQEQTKMEKEQEKMEKEQAKMEKEQEKMEKELFKIIFEAYGEEAGNFTVIIPDDVKLERNELEKARTLVEAFNERPGGSHEENRSIMKVNSVHNLWKHLIELILHSDAKKAGRRVAYEWEISHPITPVSGLRLDFTFIPRYLSHLNWFAFAGGIELKRSPLEIGIFCTQCSGSDGW